MLPDVRWEHTAMCVGSTRPVDVRTAESLVQWAHLYRCVTLTFINIAYYGALGAMAQPDGCGREPQRAIDSRPEEIPQGMGPGKFFHPFLRLPSGPGNLRGVRICSTDQQQSYLHDATLMLL